MIYLDNAATTLIKPKKVHLAAADALIKCGNPGRGGHPSSMYAAARLYECRCEIAKLFNTEKSPENVVFTLNATHALNIAIKSILHNGGHAVISSLEHNSVLRPLRKLQESNVTYSVAECPIFAPDSALHSFEVCINERKPDCVIVNHISNVFGCELPVYSIDNICRANNIPLIIDASQSAGIAEIDVSRLKSTAYICFPGHKALFGPQGTGCLICCNDKYLYSLTEGGTGSNSADENQPDFLPDIYERGTPISHGIAALAEGVKYVSNMTLREISRRHRELTRYAVERISAVPGIKVFTGPGHNHGVISFTAANRDCEELGDILGRQGIYLRAGLHCAPLAHKTAGTLNTGTVRASLSVFNSRSDIDVLCMHLNRILSKKTSVFY